MTSPSPENNQAPTTSQTPLPTDQPTDGATDAIEAIEPTPTSETHLFRGPEETLDIKRPLVMKIFGVGSIEEASMRIFFFGGISLLLLILISVPFTFIPGYRILRTTEVILTLCGVSLIVALAARLSSPAFNIFAFLLVGALIVPTNDLVKFALIATNSENNYNDFYRAPAVGKAQVSQDNEVAIHILNMLQDAEVLEFDVQTRRSLTDQVATIIGQHRDKQVIDRISRSGAIPLLTAIYNDRTSEFIYRYGGNDGLDRHIDLLNGEGLISAPYGTREDIEITRLGSQVMRRLGGQQGFNTTNESTSSGQNDNNGPNPPPQNVNNIPHLDTDLLLTQGIQAPISAADNFFRMNVPEGSFILDIIGLSAADPAVVLYDRDGNIIATDDDGGEGLNARLQFYSGASGVAQTFIINILDVEQVGGSVDILLQDLSQINLPPIEENDPLSDSINTDQGVSQPENDGNQIQDDNQSQSDDLGQSESSRAAETEF